MDAHQKDPLPARMLKSPVMWGLDKRALKPVRPALPVYGGFIHFRRR